LTLTEMVSSFNQPCSLSSAGKDTQGHRVSQQAMFQR